MERILYPENKSQSEYHCSQFTSLGKLPGDRDENNQIIGVPCNEYRINGGMVRTRHTIYRRSDKPERQVWKLLNNQYSIMHSAFPIRSYWGDYGKWIDRETFNKILAVIKNNLVIPDDFYKRIKGSLRDYPEAKIIKVKQRLGSMIQCSLKKRPVITVSGIYDKMNPKSPLSNLSIRAFLAQNPKSFFSKGKAFIGKRKKDSNSIIVQLKKNGRIEQEIFFSKDYFMKIFHKDGRITKEKMDSFPLFADFFPPCASFNKESYRISIKELYEEKAVKKEKIWIDSAPINWEDEDQGIEI